jgi:hypothetical protein
MLYKSSHCLEYSIFHFNTHTAATDSETNSRIFHNRRNKTIGINNCSISPLIIGQNLDSSNENVSLTILCIVFVNGKVLMYVCQL